YEAKKRKLDGPLLPLVARLNGIRRENEALQRLENIDFLETEQEQLIGYAKRQGGNVVIVVVNLDPLGPREGVTIVPVPLGLPPAFSVRDVLSGATYTWHIGRNYVRLEAGQAHVLRVERPPAAATESGVPA